MIKFKGKLSVIQIIIDNMSKDHVNEFSAQCAYYVILSFIPFIILLLTLIQYTNIEQQQLLSKIIPSSMSEMVLGIVREAYSKSFGTVSISLVFTLLSADKGFFALVKGLHLVYNYSDNKRKSMIYLKLTSIIKTMIFVFASISLIKPSCLTRITSPWRIKPKCVCCGMEVFTSYYSFVFYKCFYVII